MHYEDIKKKLIKYLGTNTTNFIIKIWRNTYVILQDFIRKVNISTYNKKGTKEVFDYIYQKNVWGSTESRSGPGSEYKNTIKIRQGIINIIKKYDIKIFVDAPCGDANWIQPKTLGVDYIGCDIVEDLIKNNEQKFKGIKNIEFKSLDITTDTLPNGDILLCRECLQHLSYANIEKFINNIKKSNIKYLLTTTHLEGGNKDILNGEYFDINLNQEPFLLGEAIDLLEEDKLVDSGIKKYLALYEINTL